MASIGSNRLLSYCPGRYNLSAAILSCGAGHGPLVIQTAPRLRKVADVRDFALTTMKVPGLRSSYEKVGGIVYFGRMLDKIRLRASGRLPEGYNLGTATWTWFDARCTRFLGVDYEAMAAQVLAGGTDEQVLAWCFEHGRQPGEEEIEIWNEFMMKRGWRDSSSVKLMEAKRLRGFAHRDDIQTAFDFHLADESSEESDAVELREMPAPRGRVLPNGEETPTLSSLEFGGTRKA